MADYFTYFSLVIPLKESDQQRYALDLAHKASKSRFGDEPVPNGFPTDLVEHLEDWAFETEQQGDGIWLHSENGGVDAVCVFIQHLLRRFDPKGHVGFEWSYDCSKPRPDAYGGGAAIVTAIEVKYINTAVWIKANLPDHNEGED